MSTYSQIFGTKIKPRTDDPDNAIQGEVWFNTQTGTVKYRGIFTPGVWTSAGFLNTGRYGGAGGGTATAGLYSGGNNLTVNTNAVEEYDGTAWEAGGSMAGHHGASNELQVAGTQTAGLNVGGGYEPTSVSARGVEEYDGTTWASGGSFNPSPGPPGAGRGQFGSNTVGTQTTTLMVSGRNDTEATLGTAQEYDGTSWTYAGTLGTPRQFSGGAGTQTAALNIGGSRMGTGSEGLGPAQTYALCEEYDGTSWSSGGSLGGKVGGSINGTGLQTSALAFGGPASSTEKYDGTSWTSDASMPFITRAGAGTQSSTISFGGPADVSKNTQLYTVGPAAGTKSVTPV